MTEGLEFRVGDRFVRIDPGSRPQITHLPQKSREFVADVRTEVYRAISQPVDFPPLEQAMVPGDRVVFACDPDIPRVDEVLEALVDAMSRMEGHFTVLFEETAQEDLVSALRQRLGDDVRVVVHNPDRQDELGYLAATKNADPIYLNRALLDADLVVPVILVRPQSELDLDPRSAHVYPAFSDRASQKRVRKQMLERAVRSDDEPKQVAWLLGLQLVVGVVAASGHELRAIEVGTLEGTVRSLAGQANFDSSEMDEQGADLVIACLDGNAQQQTWNNVARAILNAQPYLAVEGVLAVCTALTVSPGVGLRRLKADNRRAALARLADDPAPDAQAAAVLLKSLEERRILIQSDLRSEQLERLGFGVIEGDAELVRLIGQHRRCLVLESAQFASWESP